MRRVDGHFRGRRKKEIEIYADPVPLAARSALRIRDNGDRSRGEDFDSSTRVYTQCPGTSRALLTIHTAPVASSHGPKVFRRMVSIEIPNTPLTRARHVNSLASSPFAWDIEFR